MALRLFRYVLFIGAISFGLIGLAVAFVVVLVFIGSTKSFGVPYLWPLMPFNFLPLIRYLVRFPLPNVKTRPQLLVGRDPDTGSDTEYEGGNEGPLKP